MTRDLCLMLPTEKQKQRNWLSNCTVILSPVYCPSEGGSGKFWPWCSDVINCFIKQLFTSLFSDSFFPSIWPFVFQCVLDHWMISLLSCRFQSQAFVLCLLMRSLWKNPLKNYPSYWITHSKSHFHKVWLIIENINYRYLLNVLKKNN